MVALDYGLNILYHLISYAVYCTYKSIFPWCGFQTATLASVHYEFSLSYFLTYRILTT